jgi:hypothetical protein
MLPHSPLTDRTQSGNVVATGSREEATDQNPGGEGASRDTSSMLADISRPTEPSPNRSSAFEKSRPDVTVPAEALPDGRVGPTLGREHRGLRRSEQFWGGE